MGLKRHFINMSIKYKIINFTYLVILLITFILGTLFYSTSQKYIINRVSTSNLNIVKQINTSVNALQTDMYDLSTFIATNPTVLSFLKSYNPSEPFNSNNHIEKTELTDSMLNLVVSKEYLSLLVLYREGLGYSPYYICTDLSSGVRPYSEIKSKKTYDLMVANNGGPYWFYEPSTSQYLLQHNRNHKIVLSRAIKNPNNYAQIGSLFLGFNDYVLRDLYADTLQPENEGIAIIDQEGMVLSKWGIDFVSLLEDDEKDNLLTGEALDGHVVKNMQDSELLIAFSQDNMIGWRIFYAVDKNSLTQELNQKKSSVIIIILLCIIFSFPLLLILTSYVTSPIKNLLMSMMRFKSGDFSEQVTITQEDEIGKLSRVYNDMVIEIKELIDQNYVLEIKEREAELIALQAQINPHFLYNTLDTIFWKAQESNQKQIAEMVYSLSKLFRLSLNRGNDHITVSKEKELLEHYLSLQKIRFGDKLTYHITIDNAITHYRIPRFVLQPFVENAIVHGLEHIPSTGSIVISGKAQGNNLHFTIEDNGSGIEPDQLDKLLDTSKLLQQDIDEESSSSGYAIRNIKERLFLRYKSNYTFSITSQVGVGTKIELIVPMSDA